MKAAQIYQWITKDRLQMTRIHELLALQGCQVSYQSLRDYVEAIAWMSPTLSPGPLPACLTRRPRSPGSWAASRSGKAARSSCRRINTGGARRLFCRQGLVDCECFRERRWVCGRSANSSYLAKLTVRYHPPLGVEFSEGCTSREKLVKWSLFCRQTPTVCRVQILNARRLHQWNGRKPITT